MSAFIDAVRSANQRVLWLDATAYAGPLLAHDAVPWLDASGYVAWQRKVQALLKSDVIGVPVAQVATAWLQADAALRSSMRGKRRSVHPLKVLLADPGVREHLSGLVRDVCASFPQRVLALVLPSPRTWLRSAYALAHPDTDLPTTEDASAESAAMYVADFLRIFASESVAAVLLEEPPAHTPVSLGDPSYVPLMNLAEHYRWDIGVRANDIELDGEKVPMDFVVTSSPRPSLTCGIEVDPRFWSGTSAPELPNGGFLFAEIPVDTAPERVLERLAVLQACCRSEGHLQSAPD